MALQVWLPLDGTLENKGCANITAKSYNTTINTSGKTGSCYDFDGNNSYIVGSPSIFTNDTSSWSFACWFKPTSGATGCLFSDRTNANEHGITIFYNADYFIIDDGIRWTINTTEHSVNEWNHIAVTRTLSEKKLYINGNLIGSTSTIGTPTIVNEEHFTIGMSQNGVNSISGNKFIGAINDVRIYDHCLSQAEVHEISQGLVLHYKLDPCSHNLNWLEQYGVRTKNRSSSNTFIDYNYSSQLLNCSETHFVVDFDAKGSAEDMYIDVYFRNASDAYAITEKQLLSTDWKHYEFTLEGDPSDLVKFRLRCWSGTEGDTVYIKNMRLTSDNMPMEGTTVVDSSGYGHDGIVAGTIKFSSDSPRYCYSYVMDGLTANRIHYDENTFNYTDNFSYALWLYPTYSGTSAQFAFTNGRADAGGYGYGIQISSETRLTFRFGNSSYLMNVTQNQWVHVGFTKSGGTIKLYKNGEIYSTNTFSGTLPTYSDGNGLGLGNFHYTGDIYPAYGKISDFRIYCTALSADDIRDLYQTSVKIDNLGNIHAFELIEEENVKIRKEGVFALNNAIESGFLFNDETSFSFKPAANTNNSTVNNVVVDFCILAELCQPLTISVDADISWSNFKFGTDGTGGLTFQGANRIKESGTFAWENTNYTTSGLVLTNEVSDSENGSTHISKIATIPASWFNTFDASRFGMRCNYSDGNGTITVSNIKVTLASSNAKINKEYVSANEFIER